MMEKAGDLVKERICYDDTACEEEEIVPIVVIDSNQKERNLNDNNNKNHHNNNTSVDVVDRESCEEEEDGLTATGRRLEEDLAMVEYLSETRLRVKKGFVSHMNVSAEVIVNEDLKQLLVDELRQSNNSTSFLPALVQMANVASLPGIVKCSLAMPDVHSGYGFCIGNVAAMDTSNPDAVVSPGGVGFDINCGVRLIRTNLHESDIVDREELAQTLFHYIPVGVGSEGVIPLSPDQLDQLLLTGMDWAVQNGYAWPQDKEHCEDYGRMILADPTAVSKRAKKRGLLQLGTLGAGNHYCEVQVVDQIHDPIKAKQFGLFQGQVCIMLHSGSRGLGHQVATDALYQMESAMTRCNLQLNDLQLACAPIQSPEGQTYLKAMAASANYAWVNRSCLTHLVRMAFSKLFHKTPKELDMSILYDVSHNNAKFEQHMIDQQLKTLLVHRKGSTRAFPPHHPLIPLDYQFSGQPVLVGGTMGTCSYVLAGTQHGMDHAFGSTCHGAGRALSRNVSRKKLDFQQVLNNLKQKNISIRAASPKLITEEAPESYKDVCSVVDTCQLAGISTKVVKLRPIAVVKG